MDISMWWTTTTLTGKCMPSVEVQTPLSTAKATDMQLQPTPLQRRYCLNRYSHLPFDYDEVYILSFLIIGEKLRCEGYQESGDIANSVEGLELEVRRWSSTQWCLLHSIWSWSFSCLCQGLKLGSQVICHGGNHNCWCWCTWMPQRTYLLVLVVSHSQLYTSIEHYPISKYSTNWFLHPILLFFKIWQVYIIYTCHYIVESISEPESIFLPPPPNCLFCHCSTSVCFLWKIQCHFRNRCRSVVHVLLFFFLISYLSVLLCFILSTTTTIF